MKQSRGMVGRWRLVVGTRRTQRVRGWAMRRFTWCGVMSLLALAATVGGTEGQVPGPPRALYAEQLGVGIYLIWEAPADSGGSAITAYQVEMANHPDSTWSVLATLSIPDDVSLEFPEYYHELATGTTRFYRVSATNGSGTGAPSDVAGATTDGASGDGPGAPTDLTATGTGEKTITLAWEAPSDTGSSAVLGYEVERSNDGRFYYGLGYSISTQYTDQISLSAGITRWYRVSAHNATGLGPPSDTAAARTPVSAEPGAPTGLSAAADGDSAIDLSWTAPSDTGSSAIAGYRIEVSPDGNDWSDLEANTGSTTTVYKHTGLSPDTTLHYRVSAINNTLTGPPSDTVSARTAPPGEPGAPTGLSPAADGDSAIDLSWTAPSDTGSSAITGYRIEVSPDGSDWSDLEANTGSTSTTHKHTGLAPDTTLHYRVSAINGAGTGEPSAPDSATTDGTPPGPPTDLEATANGDSAIGLSWSPPGNIGSSEIIGYRIEVSPDGSDWSDLEANTGSTSTTHKHTGLSPDTALHYRVSAINNTNTGSPSDTASARTAPPGEPGAPTGLSATADGDSAIDLSWTAPAYTGTSAIAGYRIEVSPDGSDWSDLEANTGSTATTYKHTGLSPDTTLHYRVSATNAAGTGEPSEPDNATTDGTAPGPPTNLVATADGDSAIDLSWSPPGQTGSSAITGYRIEASPDGSNWSDLEANTGSTATTYKHTGLSPHTTLHYRVSAINNTLTGPPSDTASARTTVVSGAPIAPTSLIATADGTSAIDLSWTAPSDTGSSAITGYRIEMSPDGSNWSDLEANTDSTATTYKHTGLSSDTTLHYRVSAINGAGTGEPSEPVNATTHGTPPGPPTNLVAAADGDSAIGLSWSAPGQTGSSAITAYVIEVSLDGTDWMVLVGNTNSTATTYRHTGLSPDTTLHYRVAASNRNQIGPPSNTASARTTVPGEPGAPTGLSAAADGDSAIDLSWTAPSDTGSSAIAGYRIEVSPDGSDWSDLEANTGSTATTYKHTGLSPDTTLHYRVSAINNTLTGPPSDTASARTAPPGEPGAPTGLSAAADGDSAIDLSWTAPSDTGSSAITGYWIEVSPDGSNWSELEANTGSTATTYRHTGLSPHTTLHYRVSAINNTLTGPPSDTASARTTVVSGAPIAPTSLIATADGTSAIDLSWTAPSDTGSSAITGYRIEVSPDGSNWSELEANTGSTATTYRHTGLSSDTTLHYRVSAINGAGTGEPSEPVNATTHGTPPDPPTNLVATADGDSAIELSWSPPEQTGSSAITAYVIDVSPDGTDWTVLVGSTNSTATTYRHTGLSPDTTLHYRVAAINRTHVGQSSNTADARTIVPGAPGPPRSLTATADGDSAVDLAWDPPASPGSSAIAEYWIEVSSDAGTSWSSLNDIFVDEGLWYRHAGLSPGTTLRYRVAALNEDDLLGPPSNVASATTEGGTDDGAPGPPRNPTATADGDSAIDLSWEEPEETGGSEIVEYEIEVSNDGGQRWRVLAYTSGTNYRDSGLSSGTTRHYQVRAGNVDDVFGPFSADVSATTEGGRADGLPGPPRTLRATAAGLRTIKLSWDPPADTGSSAIVKYTIGSSSDDGDNWDNLAVTAADVTTYLHLELEPGSTWTYRVSASNKRGTGLPSNTARATTQSAVNQPPGPPRNLSVFVDGPTSIYLAWEPPTDTGGSAVSGYQIEMSADTSASWDDLAHTDSVTTEFNHTGLDAGSTMYYRVSATNANGAGRQSRVAYATTSQSHPDPPEEARATVRGTSQIDVSWLPPADDGGAPVTGYRLEVSSNGRSWAILLEKRDSVFTEYSHTGLDPGTTRHYRVSAINELGSSPPSDVVRATTDAIPPDAPASLAAEAEGSSRINLEWSRPPSNGGSPIVGYRIEVSSDAGESWATLVAHTNSTATSFSHTGLTFATTRHYRVSAINAVGRSPVSRVAFARTHAILPGPPSNLRATPNGSSRIDLTWQAPASDGGSPITGYRIRALKQGDGTWSTLVDNTASASTAYSHEGLVAASTWHYRVQAINEVGMGPETQRATATTPAGLPHAPRDPTAVAHGQSWIELNWRSPEHTGGVPIVGYRIEKRENEGSLWMTLVAHTNSTQTTHHDVGLAPGTTRHYRFSAINSVGTGPPSSAVRATTDAIVPDAPINLTATVEGATQINLAWGAPAYDGGAPVTGYRIEVFNTASLSWEVLQLTTSSNAPEYSHTHLDPVSTWTYRVSAVNSVGVSEPSNVVTATTDPAVPGSPTQLRASAEGTSQIDLVWFAPRRDGGAPITGYRIEFSVNSGEEWADLVTDTRSRATVFSDVGLIPGSTRYYRVSAINRSGVGEPSKFAHATTEATVPNPPTRLVAVAVDHRRIDLSWDLPDFDGGTRIIGYRIEVSKNAGQEWTDLSANTGSVNTTHSHTGLSPASTRHYRVSAINAVGVSRSSPIAGATTDAIAPDAPTNLVATAIAPTRISLTWTAPAYDGGARVTGYRIEVSADASDWCDLERSTHSSGTSYVHHGLQPGSTRHYRVSAINAVGTGLPSGVATASTDDPVQRAGRVNRAVLPRFAATTVSSTLSAIAGRIEAAAGGRVAQRRPEAPGLNSLAGRKGREPDPTIAQLSNGASFVLHVGGDGSADQSAPSMGMATWGGAEYHRLGQPEGGVVEWDGDMVSVHVGTDVRAHRNILVGLAVTRSSGSYDFTDATGARDIAGTYEARMTSVNPYLAWLGGGGGMAVWASGGRGWGEVTVDDPLAGPRSSPARLVTGALGASRILLARGASALNLRTEGLLSRVRTEESEGIDLLSLGMRRVRAALEWSQVNRFEDGHEFSLLLAGGARHDDGDLVDATFGVEVGGGFRYTSPGARLQIEGHGRMLATGSAGYEEWGARGLLQIDPQGGRRGLSVRLAPTWGDAASGIRQLWEQGVPGRPEGGHPQSKGRLNAEVAYGLPAFKATPFGRFLVAQDGGPSLATGVRYQANRMLDLRFEGQRTENAAGPPTHRLALRGTWRF